VPSPTYRKVCNDASFADYAETISVEFDPSILSYDDLLDAFYRAHDSATGGRSRQYASIIFCHNNDQRKSAEAKLRASDSTLIEEAPEYFWDAEPYHQKWCALATFLIWQAAPVQVLPLPKMAAPS